jgi:tetratricopeptide (TPR) repeat protein
MKAEELLNKGEQLLSRNRYQDALVAFENAAKIDPGSTSAWIKIGEVLKNLKRYEEALQAYEKAIGLDSNDESLWQRKGQVLYDLGRKEDALRAFEKAIVLNPENESNWQWKGSSLAELDRQKDALRAFEKAIELNAENKSSWLMKGDTLFALKRHKKAIKAYEKAIELDPQSELAWVGKCLSLTHRNILKALWFFWKATKSDPKNPAVWLARGCLLVDFGWFAKGIIPSDFGMYKKALRAYDKSLDLNPNSELTWALKGILLRRILKRHKQALLAFSKSIEINPEYFNPQMYLTELLLDLGDVEAAHQRVEKTLERHGADAEVWFLKGRIEIEKQDYTIALESFRKSSSLDPDKPLYLLWYAYAGYLGAEFRLDSGSRSYQEIMLSVIRQLQKAEELSREKRNKEVRAHILYFLGCFYYKSKDNIKAKEKLQECIKMNSNIRSSARELLENIWNYQIRPPLWRFWLTSPLFSWSKRIIFFILTFSIFALFLLHIFISDRLVFMLNGALLVSNLEVNWSLYTFFIVLLILILASPIIRRIKTKEIELEIHSPPVIGHLPTAPAIAEKMEGLRNHLQDD